MLFFIWEKNNVCTYCPISIHPMLFFIGLKVKYPSGYKNFNTSYVIFYLNSGSPEAREAADFNTSYVIFYLQGNIGYSVCYEISIHPMLFFIEALWKAYPRKKDFNTSYVIFYPTNQLSIGDPCKHFNTSYVIFYLKELSELTVDQLFQYILCYFLSRSQSSWILGLYRISIHPMLFFI